MFSAELLKLLDQFDVISFDVFDTLLVRKQVTPSLLFADIEKRCKRKGFARARMCAERKISRAFDRKGVGETSLDEIYAKIPHFADLQKVELESEFEGLLANQEIVDVWNRAKALGKRRVIVSDMYLPRSFVEARLRENGIDGWDGFFISSERKVRKSTGKLFKIMLDEMGVDPCRVLHIGDNPYSDSYQANEAGMVAYLYSKDEKDSALDSVLCPQIQWSKYLRDKLEATCASYWTKVGYMLGGVLGYAYVRYVGERAKTLGLTRLLLVMRDGYHLKGIFELLYPDLRVECIFAPRRLLAKGGSVGDEYRRYFQSLGILDSDKVGVVDLTTSHFSSLRLVEQVLGRQVYAFHLFVFSRRIKKLPDRVQAMYHARASSIVFDLLCEYLFTAPMPAIVGVRDGSPVHDSADSFYDRYKMAVCSDVGRGVHASVAALRAGGAEISKTELIDWMEAFVARMTRRDMAEFSLVREAPGISYRNWNPVLATRRQIPLVRISRRIVLSYAFSVRGMKRYVTFYLVGRFPLFKCRLPF